MCHLGKRAIALSNYVREYRGTDDIDIGVFLPVEEGLEILNILSGLGASTDDIDLDIVRRGEWVKVTGMTPLSTYSSLPQK